MDKKQAQQLIENIFKNPFDRERYQHFLRNFLNKIEPGSRGGKHYTGNLIPEAFNQHVTQYWCLGKYIDPDGEELDLLVVEVKTFTKLERARTALRSFAVNRLKQFDKQASLIAFYAKDDNGADWRFSFVKIEHEAYKDDKGKVKLKQELTPAKRHSFLVGVHENSHTACKQLLPVLTMDYADPRIEEIEVAFSIEKVTAEFFDQYKALFQKLAEHLKKQIFFKHVSESETDQAVSRFAKKLLGQIVFLYFLQKKGWLGAAKGKKWGDGSKNFMRERYCQIAEAGGSYYHDFLQFLFYEALARERKDQDDPGYYERFQCRVPFLNGGLFEADYEWQKIAIDIPDSLFHNEEKTKAGDTGTGILDVFDRYNFTIKEDEPLDKEVAVDPEMLGKVFENMLEVTERKSKGAFYTPREIVHYMCQESLIHYLDNRLNKKNSPPSQGGVPAAGGGGGSSEPGFFDVTDKSADQKINNLPYLKTLRKELRNNLTPAEASLWSLLQKKQLDGRKFRRQHSIINYILDFYCPAEQLAIELDGEVHNSDTQAEYDRERDLFLKHTGIKVLRFENRLVFENPDGVLQAIRDEFGWNHKQPPRPAGTPPSQGGEFELLVPKADIETLIRKGHLALENDTRVLSKGRETETYRFQLPETIRKYAHEIDSALADIKVCDPAIGSGAFPVGLLHEIVNARLALAPHSNNGKTAYDLKRHAIAESIYGVDIDASAIDIARLRLWLSLIVDEEDYGTIAALPNLDYKIVQGDSLIGIDDIGKIDDIFNPKFSLIDQLEKAKKEFFSTTDHDQKIELSSKINDLLDQISDGKQHFDFKIYFSEVWHHKGGFDVVIGNPPYVQIQNFSGQKIQKDWEAQKYESFAKTGDIYCLFYEKGYRLLKDNGALAFITSNKWMRAVYGEKLRRFFAEKTQPLTLIDFSSFQVFDTATVDTNVLIFSKEKRHKAAHACLIDQTFTRTTSLDDFVAKRNIDLDELTDESWIIISKAEHEIKKQIEKKGTPLKEWDIEINYGIKTGLSEAFVIDGKMKDQLVAQDPKSAEIIKPVLRGRDIKRYRIDFSDLWLIVTHNGYGKVKSIDVKKYPAVKTHLDMFLPQLIKRQDRGVTPYNLRNCAYMAEFEKEKILYADLSRTGNSFSLAREVTYAQNTCYMMTGENLRYLLACLNSSVILYYLDLTNQKLDKNGWRWFTHCVEKLPVPKMDPQGRKPFEIMVDYVLTSARNEQNLQSAYFEQLIDALVYELYFPDELKAAGKAILPHLGVFPPITDAMSDEAKLAIIQSEFDRLYDPRHPVRNIIETLDSVEVVRTIREALKR